VHYYPLRGTGSQPHPDHFAAGPADHDKRPAFQDRFRSILFRRLLLLAWIGSHQAADIARELGPVYAKGTCDLAERYLAGNGARPRS
jgi:hypothetical protein